MDTPFKAPPNLLFDLETLINVAQPRRILLLGDCDSFFLNNYLEQKALINQQCELVHLDVQSIDQLWEMQQPFDVGIAINLFEGLDKVKGMQILSRLRDVLSPQYCIALPLSQSRDKHSWHLTDLFSFALSKVASYPFNSAEYALFHIISRIIKRPQIG